MLGGLVTWRSYYPCLMSWHLGIGINVQSGIRIGMVVSVVEH